MFKAAHVIIDSRSPETDRAFLRDVVGLPYVDSGDGWLIFKLPPSELAFHPTDGETMDRLYFMCDDIEATLGKLVTAGAAISSPVTDQRWGRIAEVSLPSGTILPIYEPRHRVAYNLG
jgi:hypothetical protein